MRKLSVLVLALLLFSTSAAVAGQFGPAEAQTKPGQVALGIGAFAYNDEWDFDGFATTDVRQTEAFLQMNLGLFPGWEVYLRGGGADISADEILNTSDFKDNLAPFATAGLKGLFRKGKYMDVGGFMEGSYFPEYEDEETSPAGMLIIEEGYSVNAGLAFQKEIEGALLYGGPFFHYREADFWLSYVDQTNTPQSRAGTAKEDGNLGAFLGIRWVALKDIVIEAEAQLRNNVSVGGAVTFLF